MCQVTGDDGDDDDPDPWNGGGGTDEEDDEGGMEYFVLQESTGYMAPTLRFLAILHTVISFLCVVGYYYLKVHFSITQTHIQITNLYAHIPTYL